MYTWFCTIVFMLLMVIVVIQDFKDRAISAFLPLLIFITAFVCSTCFVGIEQTATITICNIIILGLQFLLLYGYVRIVRNSTNLTDKYLGWGDILFLLAISPLLSPLNFILFNLLAFVATAIGYALYTLIVKDPNKHIPLAGSIALIVAVAITLIRAEQWEYYMYDDYWMLDLIHNANG